MCNIEHLSENACGVCWSINQEREKGGEGGGKSVNNYDGKETTRLSPVLEANDNADGDDESQIGCTVAKNDNS
jgi:hypothetical protein